MDNVKKLENMDALADRLEVGTLIQFCANTSTQLTVRTFKAVEHSLCQLGLHRTEPSGLAGALDVLQPMWQSGRRGEAS